MRDQLLAAVAAQGGVIRRADALVVASRHVVDDAVRRGVLVVVYPGVYAESRLAGDRACRQAAGVAYTGGALSHLDALQRWSLLPPEPYYRLPAETPVHVTVPGERGPTRRRDLVVHRRRGFWVGPPDCVVRRGQPLVRLEDALIDSWPLLPATERRTPLVAAVRGRMTTASRLLDALAQRRAPSDVAELRSLIELLDAGCHSELELFGHARLLDHPQLPRCRRQFPIALPRGTIYLDAYFEAEMVAVEFDGAAYHGSQRQRERDTRRDAVLAALGILTVRVTHQRLCHATDELVRELMEILAMRRRQLLGASA